MTSNIDQFLKDTNKKIEELQKKQVSYGRNVINTAQAALITESPVATGLYMHNHIITVNSPTSKTITDTGTDKDALISRNEAQVNILKFKHKDTIYIQNSLDYAGPTTNQKYLTIEEGHSQQAKEGVYGVVERQMEKFLTKNEKG